MIADKFPNVTSLFQPKSAMAEAAMREDTIGIPAPVEKPVKAFKTIDSIIDCFTRFNRIEKNDPASLHSKLQIAEQLRNHSDQLIAEVQQQIVGEVAKLLKINADKIDIDKLKKALE